MQRLPHKCPLCNEPLVLGGDMWGPFYYCDDCGWTAEDDDDLVLVSPPISTVIKDKLDGNQRPEATPS